MARSVALRRTVVALTLMALAAPLVRAQAQNPTPAPPPAPTGPAVGEMAPDFTLPGATRYGRLRDPVNLSSYRGSTVVLAFFVKARTRG
jgi:hypothetical protein